MSIEWVETSARAYRQRRKRNIGWQESELTTGERTLSLYIGGQQAVLTEDDVLELMHVLTTFMVGKEEEA